MRAPTLRRCVRVAGLLGALGCAGRGADPPSARTQTLQSPAIPSATCEAAERGAPGWLEQRIADTPVAFCAPPDIRYVERSRRFAPTGPRPYPRPTSVPDWTEEWTAAPGSGWTLIAALFAAPNGWPTLAADVERIDHAVVAAASSAAGDAVLRRYRVSRDTVPVLRPGGNERFSGFGLSPEKAELVVPLGPGRWLVLAANVEKSERREELLRVLRSARWVDR